MTSFLFNIDAPEFRYIYTYTHNLRMTQNQNHALIAISKQAAKLVQQYLAAEEVSPEGKSHVRQSLDVIRDALERFKYVIVN